MKPWRTLWKSLGPGLISGASDDDPSGIATYTIAGAMFGFGTLWTTLISVPLMAAVQEACARIAFVTHKGLIQNLRKKVPYPILFVGVMAFVAATAFNLGADLKIMASTAALITPFPVWFWIVFFGLATIILQLTLGFRRYVKVLKWLCLSLFAYVAVAFIVQVDWFWAMAWTFSPQLSLHHGYWLAALFGTAFSPYLCIWQTTQEVEMEKYEGCIDAGCRDRHVCDMNEVLYCRRMDIGVGVAFANLMAWFIIIASATVLFANGIYDIGMPGQLAAVLAPLAGPYATHLFALGIIGAGLMAIPVLSGSAAYALSELFEWKRFGLSRSLKEAPQFYLVIVLATIAGMAMMLSGIPSILALVYAAIANAFVSPFMLLGILLLSSDKKLMGQHVNGPISRTLLWATMILICSALALWLVFG